jgi:hypothetical protein
VEPENSLPSSQEHDTVPYPETDEYSAHPFTVTLILVFNIILRYIRKAFAVK